jgi:hypothetical protein
MNKIIALCLLLVWSKLIHACDVCGANASNYSIGITPMFSKHFLSIRYQSSSFSSKAHHGTGESTESFSSLTLWSRWSIHKRVQLGATLPFQRNYRVTNENTEQLVGLGDASLSLHYLLINSMKSSNKFKHMLQLGSGIKMPTGKYNVLKNNLLLEPNMQLGSGAWDVQPSIFYLLRYQKIGFNFECNYIYRGTNPMDFAFGDRMNAGLHFFTWQKKKQISYIPQIGLLYEYAAQDVSRKKIQSQTGGNSWLATSGIDLFYKKIGLGVNIQLPIKQHLGDGYIKANHRINVNFNCLL